MSKSKKRTKSAGFFAVILALILAIGGIAYLTRGFKTEVKTFAVGYDGKKYVTDCNGLILKPDTKFSVYSVSDDYTITVTAAGSKTNDFSFTVGNEKMSWYDSFVKNHWDFTDYLAVTRSEKDFEIENVGLYTILSRRFPTLTISLPAKLPSDLFCITVTVDGSSMALNYTPYIPVTGVELPASLEILR